MMTEEVAASKENDREGTLHSLSAQIRRCIR